MSEFDAAVEYLAHAGYGLSDQISADETMRLACTPPIRAVLAYPRLPELLEEAGRIRQATVKIITRNWEAGPFYSFVDAATSGGGEGTPE